METNGYASQNGLMGTKGTTPKMKTMRTRSRPPTVEEALPYSPFSSVVPFNSDIIPTPTVGLRSSASLFSNSTERNAARQDLDGLNRELTGSTPTSVLLQQTLENLKELLQPPNITQYAFKMAPKSTSAYPPAHLSKAPLTPFSQMLYESTAPEYTYPSPETPTSQSSRNIKVETDKFRPSPKPIRTPWEAVVNQEAYHETSSITVEIPVNKEKVQTVTPPQRSAPRPSQNFAVVIPTVNRPDARPHPHAQVRESAPSVIPRVSEELESSITVQLPRQPAHTPKLVSQPAQPRQSLAHQHDSRSNPNTAPSGSNPNLAVLIPHVPINPADFDVIANSPSPGTPQNLSKKRRLSHDGSNDELMMTYDQRQKSDLAFKNLCDYLRDIFEADDQQEQGGAVSTHFFTATNDGLSLSTATQSKIESLLQKTIEVGRFTRVPLDDLLRLQKLCENAIKDGENVEMKVDESMGESEIESVMQQIPIAELGLKSARTSLRLMAGGREDKQLYSEDAIQAALNTFRNIMDTCIIPIIEMRSTGATAAVFKLLLPHRKEISILLTFCRRLLSLLATIAAQVELSDTVINTLEFTASRLIFVENAHVEKDSILGIAKFDSLRVVAMDVLAQIFLKNETQRQGIFDEILTSLEKLPSTKQGARQFKLAEGGSIQLVSALIMRLIQTSASKADTTKEIRRAKALEAMTGDEETNQPTDIHRYTITSESRAEQQVVTAIQELQGDVNPLLDTAKHNATYVIGFIVNRALNSTKSGDDPYRKLLDLFVEDFITCLKSTDWPAAELLLRLLLFKMVHLAEDKKTPAPAKNMALDLLGSMGAAISELNSHVRKTASSLENDDSDLGKYLSRLAESALEKKAAHIDLVSWACGPFRVSLEFVNQRFATDPQLGSAIGFYMAEWASKICDTYELLDEEDQDHNQIELEYGRLAYRLRMMISDRKWLSTEYSFDSITVAHARLAYDLTLVSSKFCESFGRVLMILLGSMTSEQATVRSKSMKSVNQVLDTDPSILDREPAVKKLLLGCLNDSSILVRDSALGLIGKCMGLRPSLEEEMIPNILARINDAGVGVRKRAMRLAKEIYLRNKNAGIRSSIADQLLHRVTDHDEGVQELARQTIEEVWMSPFYQPASSNSTSVQYKLAMAEQVTLIVKTIQRGSGVAAVLDKVLQGMLAEEAKQRAANFKVCKALVATMFETIIDNSNEGKNVSSARDALQVLQTFAKSNALLFTPEQVQLLQPYTANVNSSVDDLAVYRSVVVIFRHVLPHLSKVHDNFLVSVRKELLSTLPRMGKVILDDVVACLWIISKALDNYQHLGKVLQGSLGGIKKTKITDLSNDAHLRKLNKLLLITGMLGKHCDLDSQLPMLKPLYPKAKEGDSVSKLMTDTIVPFASPGQSLEVRKNAFDAIGMICQSWPKNFRNANIECEFKEVFASQIAELEVIIMGSFKDFLFLEEKRSEAKDQDTVGVSAEGQAKLGVMGGAQGDGVANNMAQAFVSEFDRISLATQGESAFLATELLATIARQGLVHPMLCAIPLIALETSQNTKIADLAFRSHRALHEKHESMMERAQMKAVERAYQYQRDVVHDIHGATLDPFTSKLSNMIEALKISKISSRKKFFKSLAVRVDFDPEKMEMDELPHHLEFAQFIVENMAFFDYVSMDELLTTISAMEKVVAGDRKSVV